MRTKPMQGWRRQVRRIWRKPLLVVGILIVLGVLVMAVFPGQLAPYDPFKSNLAHRLEPPSKGHWFGTDPLGRDLLSRVIYGSRVSVITGFVVVFLAAAIGSFAGALAGFYGGALDQIVMRIVDVLIAFPYMILAMALAAALGPSLINTMIALSIVWVPRYARMMRGQVLQAMGSEYIESAKALGVGRLRILVRHLLPNCFEPVLIKGTLDVGTTIMYAAALGFIGLGAQPPSPEWGAMISQSRSYILYSWWYTTFPGFAILVACLGFNLIGDGIRDLVDPRTAKT
ncbi:MAG: ABC transporter permease [Candidatus Bipolaricaulota bacterium]|nr:ABC transporter permease [Candidatus Bipolaricaulota bacterium]